MTMTRPSLRAWFLKEFSINETYSLVTKLATIPNEQLLTPLLQKAMAENANLNKFRYSSALSIAPIGHLLMTLLNFPKPHDVTRDPMIDFLVKYRREIHQLAAMDQAAFKQLVAERQTPPKDVTHLIGAIVVHRTIGKVVVTEHAWQRFCERYAQIIKLPPTVWPQRFIDIFQTATQVMLPQPLALKRLLSNSVEPAMYYYHHDSGLRFVVRLAKPTENAATLLTVEIPN